MADPQDSKWSEMLSKLTGVLELTSQGEIVLVRGVDSAEDLIVTCLVGQFVAHRAGRATKEAMAIDDIIAAGGLTYRPARQTIYNCTSRLAKGRIILKDGNEFKVGERVVVQYFSTKLPRLLGQGGNR